MLAISTSGRHRGSIANRGDAWRRHTPSVITSLELKRQQLLAAQRQLQLDLTSSDELEPEESPIKPRRRVFTAFRRMVFTESDDEEESDYVPSEEEREEGDSSAEELREEELEKEEQDDEVATAESEDLEELDELDDDSRWWDSSEDKRRWEKRYRQADAAFRKRFGCAIDTPAHPETRRRIRKKKNKHQAYKIVLVGLMIAFLVQLAVVYSASSWAFSMVTWQAANTENASSDTANTFSDTSKEHSEIVSKPTAPTSQQQVPEHVRTGLYLCSTLSRKVIKSEYDVTATQHALRACDIAVKFAPPNSREAIKAHVLRGDLRSLLLSFDGADEDYKAATILLEFDRRSTNPRLAPELSRDLDLKLIANHWTQLYKTKRFKELRREAKVHAELEIPGNAVSKLAADWLSAFKRKKAVLDVLTIQRGWTLRRLKYEALDEEDKTKPDEVKTT